MTTRSHTRLPSQHHARLPSLALSGPGDLQGLPIESEALIRRGLPGFQITGLTGARETADRIRSAIHASGLTLPGAHWQVNLSPVDLRKTGACYDLGIAASLLAAAGVLARPFRERSLFAAELALDGRLLPLRQLPALLFAARTAGFRRAVVPCDQLDLAGLVPGIELCPIHRLRELSTPEDVAFHGRPEQHLCSRQQQPARLELVPRRVQLSPLFDSLAVDTRVHRALVISAAGWHSSLLIGPPGSGKTSLARDLVGLLPAPDPEACLEIFLSPAQFAESTRTTAPHERQQPIRRPLRSPHHSCTRAAMIGGGIPPTAGEITRAHHGVLLLDELAEFSRETLQALREPVEQGQVLLSRGEYSFRFPAHFLLIATTNPCACGRQRAGLCECTGQARTQYMNRILGPLRDRIDLEVPVEGPDPRDERLSGAQAIALIDAAGERQRARLRKTRHRFNGEIPAAELEALVPLRSAAARSEYQAYARSRQFSYRTLAGIRRTARTVADLEGAEEIRPVDLQEALYYRCLDRYWS